MPAALGSTVLEVGIGLAFLYLMLSLLASIINEMIAQLFALRARTLEDGLVRLLHGQVDKSTLDNFKEAIGRLRGTATGSTNPLDTDPVIAQVMNHPLISALSSKGHQVSYIPSRQFAVVLLDVVAHDLDSTAPDYVSQFRAAVTKMSNTHLRDALLALIDQSANDVQALRRNLEDWFNDAMDRVSGWYKRTSAKILLVIGLILALIINADSLGVAHLLWVSPATREAVVAAAQSYVNKLPTPAPTNATPTPFEPQAESLAKDLTTLQTARLPLGWMGWPTTAAEWLRELAGIVITTLLVSLGAPFWFDVLSKFMNIRNSGPVSSGSAPNDTSRNK
jgi:hypothetical protein